mmetsp:Transcript_25400/g.71053  ORF Transcript_25400/g.71053 Transcript_25400/m.71053 type:complete len:109 (+) Transcript_25400:161-487(+)
MAPDSCQSPSPQFDRHLPYRLHHVEDSERGIFSVDGTGDENADEEVPPARDYEEEDQNEYMEGEELGELELGEEYVPETAMRTAMVCVLPAQHAARKGTRRWQTDATA